MGQNESIEQNKTFGDKEKSEIKITNNEESELQYIIHLMESKDICITDEELDFCQYVKLKLGNRLVYASMLFYRTIYYITNDEEAKKLWLEFKDVIEKDEQEIK